MNTLTAPDLRETSNTYAHQVHRYGLLRVARCRDGLQWLLQVATENRPDVWRNEAYCISKEALLREWSKRSGEEIPTALRDLPERIQRGSTETR